METSQVQSVLPEGYILQAPANTYRIEKTLGMGGFGITYLATTTVQFGNLKTTISVAIKEHFISDSCERDTQTHSIVYSNPVKNRVEGSRRDFIAEARRLQKVGIEHPNIVKVNEVFETNNTAYYVMEYLEGKSLRAYVKQRGKLEENEMLALMRPIMSAVRLLHEHYMTHLDIKPDNIMLTTDEHGNARPVLIDFGLSKHYGKNNMPASPHSPRRPTSMPWGQPCSSASRTKTRRSPSTSRRWTKRHYSTHCRLLTTHVACC